MPEPPPGSELDAVEAGWRQLAAGRWTAARRAFEGALAVEETAEALEGLSWAAWWLDDAEVVFRAREQAYRRYRERGDSAAAARMAAWLAADELDFHGASAVANGWLHRAQRLLDPLEPVADHGWLAFFQGYVAQSNGDLEASSGMGVEAERIGRRFGVVDLEMLGLALQGAALVARARVDEGMRCLDEATVLAVAGEARVPISGAWACCFLVSACSSVLDFDRAAEWCERIAAFAERYGSRYMLAFCRAEYGTVHLWRGRWDEAEEVLGAAIEDYSASRPAMVAGPTVGLAELRRRQGRADEAQQLLDGVEPSPDAQLCRARVAMDRGDPLTCAELLERLLRRLPEDATATIPPVLELLVRARVAHGALDEAAATSEGLQRAAEAVGTPAVRALADRAHGVLAAALGDSERARRLLEDAVDGFEACGAPFEASLARLELAKVLAALGRDGIAEREAVAALEGFRRLGAAGEVERARRLLHRGRDDGAPAPELTPREREVLGLLAEGLTNHQIASKLVVSEHTVHRHVTNILRKLGLPSRAAAAAHAVRSGVTGTPDA